MLIGGISLVQYFQSNQNTRSYTNQKFPNLKINYDNSWKIESSTAVNLYQETYDLKREDIILRKNDTKLAFKIMAIIPTGCANEEEISPLFKTNNYNRYKTPNNPHNDSSEDNLYFYSKNSTNCGLDNLIKSGIETKSLLERTKMDPNFAEYLSQFDNLPFIVNISLESSNPNEINQADEIIRNSVFE